MSSLMALVYIKLVFLLKTSCIITGNNRKTNKIAC
jgi:hypothetical protein